MLKFDFVIINVSFGTGSFNVKSSTNCTADLIALFFHFTERIKNAMSVPDLV